MFLNPFNKGQAEPLRQRRIWRDPRREAYAVSATNSLTHMRASFAANVIANLIATQPATLVANHSAAGMPESI